MKLLVSKVTSSYHLRKSVILHIYFLSVKNTFYHCDKIVSQVKKKKKNVLNHN